MSTVLPSSDKGLGTGYRESVNLMALLKEDDRIERTIVSTDDNIDIDEQIANQNVEEVVCKVSINYEKIGNLEYSFDEIVDELRNRIRKKKFLEYNQENVELLLRGIIISPPSEQYPHPEIWKLFNKSREKLVVERNCVASWANTEAMGLKAATADIRPGEILGVYGGVVTKDKGLYTLDVSVTGQVNRLVDGSPEHGEITLFGRINEDIHYNKLNVGMDIAGIMYTTSRIRLGQELLTTYGDRYRWDHVVQIGLDRIQKHISEFFSNLKVGLPRKLEDLKESNPLHAWAKNLLWDSTEGFGHHSTRDKDQEPKSIKGLISHLTSNEAHYKYAFRKCGLPEKKVDTADMEGLGRKYIEYISKIKDKVIEVPFQQVIRNNMRIGPLELSMQCWSDQGNCKNSILS